MDPNQIFEEKVFKTLALISMGIAKTFGSRCEVVVHDLRNLDKSIVHIENSHVTGRSVGGSVLSRLSEDKGLSLLKKGIENQMLINYSTTASDGRALKSTTVIITNLSNEAIAALCINFDLTDIQTALGAIGDIFKIEEREDQKQSGSDDIIETVIHMIQKEVDRYPCAVNAMKKIDRVRVVEFLHEQGVFATKGAVKIVAAKLNVSKHAIYSYLDEIKTKNER